MGFFSGADIPQNLVFSNCTLEKQKGSKGKVKKERRKERQIVWVGGCLPLICKSFTLNFWWICSRKNWNCFFFYRRVVCPKLILLVCLSFSFFLYLNLSSKGLLPVCMGSRSVMPSRSARLGVLNKLNKAGWRVIQICICRNKHIIDIDGLILVWYSCSLAFSPVGVNWLRLWFSLDSNWKEKKAL